MAIVATFLICNKIIKKRIQSTNKVIEYIEDHLAEDICCEDVADVVYVSVFHFQRTFNFLTGMNMGEYIRKYCNRNIEIADYFRENPEVGYTFAKGTMISYGWK